MTRILKLKKRYLYFVWKLSFEHWIDCVKHDGASKNGFTVTIFHQFI
jgi:hypothetical protein